MRRQRSNRLLQRSATLTLGSFLLFALAVPAVANHPKKTIFVSANDSKDDGAGCGKEKNPCDTLQRGIDHAQAGETVRILKGTYHENVVIPPGKDGLALQGVARAKVVLVPDVPAFCTGDPTRTFFAGGPKAMACRQFDGDETGCDTAWAVSRSNGVAAVSCFWEDSESECRGCGSNNQDKCANSCEEASGAGISVESANVSIRSLTVRGGIASGIFVDSAGTAARISRVDIKGTAGACVAVRAASTQLKQSTLNACGSGVDVAADDVLVQKVSVSQCGDSCIFVEGDGARIKGNQVSLGETCIEIEGNDAVVTDNTATLCDGYGIEVDGNSMAVSDNATDATDSAGISVECNERETYCVGDATRTFFAGGPYTMACRQFDGDSTGCATAWAISNNNDGVPVSCFWASDSTCRGCASSNQGNCTNTCQDLPCTAGLVDNNVVTGVTADSCFDVRANGAGLVVAGNRGSQCTGGGYWVDGTGIEVRRNKALGIGVESRDHGFSIRGDDHTLSRNLAKGASGDGFNVDVESSGNTLSSNTALGNAGDGFDVEPDAEDTTLEENLAKGNLGAGIEISAGASDILVLKNTASKNQVDFCNDGSPPISVVGNDFGTSGDCRADSSSDR
jgi:parallel beta-helix repeat protein